MVDSLEVGTIQKDESATKPKTENDDEGQPEDCLEGVQTDKETSTELSPACFPKPNIFNREMGGKRKYTFTDKLRQDQDEIQLIARISQNRDGESEVRAWEQGINGGEGESTAVHCCIASE